MSSWRLPVELLLAVRYLRAETGNRFLSFISVIGLVGIAIGVAVLIVVLSVMNGFEEELRSRILDVTPHATLAQGEGGIAHWQPLLEAAARQPGVAGVAPYIESQSLLVAGQKVSGVQVEGIDPGLEGRVSNIAAKVSQGSLAALVPGGYRVALGRALAAELGVTLGDRVLLLTPQGTASPAGLIPRTRRLTVAAIIDSGMYEYDRRVALVSLADAAKLYRLGDSVSGLRLKVADPYRAPRVVREVAVGLGPDENGQAREWYVRDWTRAHANFFQSIATTKSIMFAILLLVVAVASFNVVSTLVMLVREKRHDIAILRTLGLSPRGVLLVFFALGTAIGFLGTLAGIALGWLVASNVTGLVHGLERLLGVSLIDAKVYFIDELPSRVRPGDVLVIGVTAFLLACLSTLLPAWWAARTQPAEALRHDQ
jgi:lipoprotein-releasing system permease protein